MQVIGVLLLTNYEGEGWVFQKEYQVTLSTVDGLESILKRIINKTKVPTLTLEEIIDGVYEPSPSMLEAARSILNNEPLPDIKAVSSSNFPEVQQTVRS
ncbi:hypothetical protein FC695_36900, partial [Bacillus cereus]